MRLGIVIALLSALTLGLGVFSPAQAAPAHPDRWVHHEAHRMGCVVDHHESLPFGPPNTGVSCHVGTQRYDVLYYRRVGDAMAWWKHWVRGGRGWIARDGLVLVIPQGSTESGVDSGLYGLDEAAYAARRLGGVVVPV